MSEPDYVAAVKVVKKHYEGLCGRVANEILGNPDRAEEMLDEILADYWQKFCAVDSVYNHLDNRIRISSNSEARRAQEIAKQLTKAPVASPPALRVDTIHCRADVMTETIN